MATTKKKALPPPAPASPPPFAKGTLLYIAGKAVSSIDVTSGRVPFNKTFPYSDLGEHIVGACYVFDDYDAAFAYGGPPTIVTVS